MNAFYYSPTPVEDILRQVRDGIVAWAPSVGALAATVVVFTAKWALIIAATLAALVAVAAALVLASFVASLIKKVFKVDAAKLMPKVNWPKIRKAVAKKILGPKLGAWFK